MSEAEKPDQLEYASDEDEAKERAARFRYVDPFTDIKPALLSSKDFIRYVKATALIHPFFESAERIKAASYEVRAKGNTIRYDDSGRKIVTPLEGTLFLPKNSITFVQIEATIRLPQYIALRFNLRIANVHRGLLLGTGPLIDPEFEGDLLIPIHNLTDQDYAIPTAEGLIWIEFTKTSSPPDSSWKYRIEPRKSLVKAETYLEKANQNNPIRSSIGGAINVATQKAADAEASATAAKDHVDKITTWSALGLGVFVVATVIALHSYFGTMSQLAGAIQNTASTALTKVEALTTKSEALTTKTDSLTSASDDTRRALDDAKRALEDARKDITALQVELSALKSRPAPRKGRPIKRRKQK